MSGMEALAIFSIACNVMQTISFFHESASILKQLHEEGCADSALHKAVAQIHDLTQDLSESIKKGGQPYSKEETDLLEVANDCHDMVEKLGKELEKLTVENTTKVRKISRTIGVGVRRILKKSTIEKLEKDLSRAQENMETRLLIQLCNKHDATALQHDESFGQISEKLRHFIDQCSEGHTKLESLVKTEVESLKAHTEAEHIKTTKRIEEQNTIAHEKTVGRIKHFVGEEHKSTRTQISQQFSKHIDNLQQAAGSDSQRNKLLNSLDFPKRDERLSDIKEAHLKTFQWLLGEDNRDTDVQQENGERDEIYEELLTESREMTWYSFTIWLESNEPFYWISGKAGAGKSTLMKFLFQDERTMQSLRRSSRREPIVLFHSFYLMGSQLQNSIKGLLCSLIHQLLRLDHSPFLLQKLFNQYPRLSDKQSESSWSVEELEKVLLELLNWVAISHQVCLFLDGLDEVYAVDGKSMLLRLLDRIKTQTSVRMCVSSRPEAEFTKRFSAAPMLNLHTLTSADMYQYALNVLTPLKIYPAAVMPNEPMYTLEYRRSLACVMVRKANGVFLWADVAIRSLQRGIANGDTPSLIEQRLDQMPEKLDELFASMWNRLGDDQKLYRAKAALYFNLVLDSEHFSHFSTYRRDRNGDGLSTKCWYCKTSMSESRWVTCTLIQLSISSRGVFTKAPLETPNLDSCSAWADCLETFKELPVVSAGLLELSGPPVLAEIDGHEHRYLDSEVRFIHRTAREFLVETVEGQKICGYDKSYFEHRFDALLSAIFTRAESFQSHDESETPLFCFNVAEVDTKSLIKSLQNLKASLQEDKWLQVLGACQRFHDNKVGVRKSKVWRDFLAVAVECGEIEYTKKIFQSKHSTQFTPAYQGLLLVCAAEGLRTNNSLGIVTEQNVSTQLDMIEYLLMEGCRSQLVTHSDYGCFFKVTGLERFLDSILCIGSVLLSDKGVSDAVIEILKEFAKSGADFLQPMYGYYKFGFLWGEVDPMLVCSFFGRLLPKHIFVEWSILGIMTRAVEFELRRQEPLYFYQRLQAFLSSMKQYPAVIRPCAVIPRSVGDLGNWMHPGKRVRGEHAQCLIDKVTQPLPSKTKDWESHFEQLDKELSVIADDILDDSLVPVDVSDYLLNELGIAESWPRVLQRELSLRGVIPQVDDE